MCGSKYNINKLVQTPVKIILKDTVLHEGICHLSNLLSSEFIFSSVWVGAQGLRKDLMSIKLKLSLGTYDLKWKKLEKKAKSNCIGTLQMSSALYLNLADSVVACVWRRAGSFDAGTSSLIWFYSDLKLTKNSATSIPLRGALPISSAI